ncbi:uncharacterized protein VNE69_02113 [Vairimorpha necatrix]|uniref:Uncharacterized protein n=1 Tax=Vairimorpha necatrix TaxID=6039 RepID=A0AAX4J9J9_9MICR
MILCEICKTKFRCIDGEYICEEGHISQTKLEVADDLHFTTRSQKHITKKEASVFSKYCFTYRKLLLYTVLFKDLVSFLKCSSTKFIDLYTNFFSGDRKIVSSPIKIQFGHLIILGYLTKRTELEKNGKLYFFQEYLNEIETFDYRAKIKNIKNIFDMKKIINQKLGITKRVGGWLNKHKIMDILGTAKYPCNKKHKKIISETSLGHPLIEYNKALIRQEIGYSEDLLIKYFYKILEYFTIQLNEDLENYFKKYLSLRNLSNKMFTPEDEVSIYLFLYNEHKKLEIDYNQALKNLNIFLKNKYYDENIESKETSLVDLIVLLTHTSYHHFYFLVSSTLKSREFKSTNNIFVITKTKKQYYRNIKWKAFRIYIRRIKMLLKNNINYKSKKNYIEDDRI